MLSSPDTPTLAGIYQFNSYVTAEYGYRIISQHCFGGLRALYYLVRTFTIDNLDRLSLESYTPVMRRTSDANKHHADAFLFGVDKAPAVQPRRESRLPCTPTETHVYVGDMSLPIRAAIHDVSRWGLRLVLAQPISVGSAVKVETAGMVDSGEIRYCNRTRDGSFTAGMRIDSTQKLD